MRFILPLFAAAVLVGCSPSSTEPETPAATPEAPATGAQGGSASVAPIGSGAAGGMTPVTGAENLGGGTGGGIASAAKGQAGRAAGMAGGGSISQMPTEGE